MPTAAPSGSDELSNLTVMARLAPGGWRGGSATNAHQYCVLEVLRARLLSSSSTACSDRSFGSWQEKYVDLEGRNSGAS